jgi:Holliday junction resolvasome RuvABC endonuclease subunit
LVAIEGYSYASHGRSTVSLAELGGIVRYGLWCEGIIYIDVPPSTLKKYATGKGNADKGAMLVAAVKRLGYEGTDNNEADARWLHAVGMALMGKPVANVPELHRNALGALGTERLDAMLGAKPDDAA